MKQELDRIRQYYADYTPGLLDASACYAVLVPLTEIDGALHLIFEVRDSRISQGGEVCFPGGRLENCESPVSCALRETEEELAIPAREIEVLGTPDFISNQKGFLLHPVLGLVSPEGYRSIVPAPSEVAAVFTVPLSFFRETAPVEYQYDLIPQMTPSFPYDAVGIPRDYQWNRGKVSIPIWLYNGRAIWGITARLVRDLIRHI